MRTGNVKLSDYGIDVLKLGKTQSQMELVTAGRGANDVVINDFYPVEIEGELGVIVPSYETTITDSERLMLARLTFAEAGNQDLYGQRLVVDVVLNRRDKSEWPNTIEGVIFQKSQFSTIDDGAYARTVGEDLSSCYEAIEKELYGRLDYNIIYFNSGEY
jgi:spore germination cell wall hydrolase CwlJ-like protein